MNNNERKDMKEAEIERLRAGLAGARTEREYTEEKIKDLHTEIARLKADVAQLNEYVIRKAGECNSLRVQHEKDIKLITELAEAVEDLEPDGFEYGPLVQQARQRSAL